MRTLSVRVLGTFEVLVGDRPGPAAGRAPEPAPGSRKARRLLRLLALARGRPVRVDALVDALWPSGAPARPHEQVAVLASRLRRGLGRDRIRHGDHGYQLLCDWLDADELDTVVHELGLAGPGDDGRAAQLARLVASLVRGPVTVEDDDPDWVRQEIAGLERLAARGLALAADALISAGDPLAAADLAAAVVDRDAYDEHAVRLLMRAHTQAGRPGAALAAYAALRDRLRGDLGTDPDPETSRLHTAVLQGTLATPPGTAAAPRLVGRESQLTHLDELADRAGRGTVRVAVVTGEAGIGKSTLLESWAARRGLRGDVVLLGRCGTLEQSVPLDAVLSALADHLRTRDDADELLGTDAPMLGRLLGREAGTGEEVRPTDAVLGAALLFGALDRLLAGIAGRSRVLVLLDDAHRAGPSLSQWLEHLQRRVLPVLIVAATRPGEGRPITGTDSVALGPLDRQATVQLVGRERADALFERSLGHPLFLTALATSPDEDLPGSLVEHVVRRCQELGPAGDLLRAAAVIGPPFDLDLLANVLGRPLISVLDDAELAVMRGLLVPDAGRFRFRHDLVCAALASDAADARVKVLHREAGRVLATRPDSDPMLVADHARLGGDTALAARSLRAAGLRAAERFDLATAERLLGEAVLLDPAARLDRARVRVLRRDYAGALDDADRAGAGADGLVVGAWAAYFARDFATARRLADAGTAVADEPDVAARCAMVGGRVRHAVGDLHEAEPLLLRAARTACGSDRVAASAWLGVLRVHQARHEEALGLLGPAAGGHLTVVDTSALLHAILFSGLAHAGAGRPAMALAAFDHYTAEVERRQVPRFGGRGVNCAGWVLRCLGELDRGRAAHERALEESESEATQETFVAALQDLAEDALEAHEVDGADPAAATAYLDRAAAALGPDLVFGWRLELRQQLLTARRDLALGDAARALTTTTALAHPAAGVPRYRHAAVLLEALARSSLGEPVDRDVVEAHLAGLTAAAAVDAWRWWGRLGAALGVPAWIDRAEAAAADLAAGGHAPALHRQLERRLAGWRAVTAR